MGSLSSILGISLRSYFKILAIESMRTGLWGDFNESLDASKNCGGRHKSGATMNEFCRVVSNLALVDGKSNRG